MTLLALFPHLKSLVLLVLGASVQPRRLGGVPSLVTVRQGDRHLLLAGFPLRTCESGQWATQSATDCPGSDSEWLCRRCYCPHCLSLRCTIQCWLHPLHFAFIPVFTAIKWSFLKLPVRRTKRLVQPQICFQRGEIKNSGHPHLQLRRKHAFHSVNTANNFKNSL